MLKASSAAGVLGGFECAGLVESGSTLGMRVFAGVPFRLRLGPLRLSITADCGLFVTILPFPPVLPLPFGCAEPLSSELSTSFQDG